MEYSPIVRFTPLVPPAIARAGTAQRAVPTDNLGMHRLQDASRVRACKSASGFASNGCEAGFLRVSHDGDRPELVSE
jgi:hypothetical protein